MMWKIVSLWHRIFKKFPRVSHTALLLWRNFHAPKRDAAQNKLWLVLWHVGPTASWAGLDQWTWPSIPDLQRQLHTSAQPIARVWGVATVAGWARGCFFVEKEIQISLQKCRPKFKDLPKYQNTQKQIRYAKRKVKSIPNMLDLLLKAAHFTWLDMSFYFHRYRWTVYNVIRFTQD